jgi:hypothetical protein
MARPPTSTSRLLAGSREPVRVATTGNINPAAGGLLVIDGVTLEPSDRVLLKDQADQRQNGIYGASAGEWYRASDGRSSRSINKGTTVHVQEGTANGGKVYAFQTLDPVIGTDDIQINFYISDDIVADAEDDMEAIKDDIVADAEEEMEAIKDAIVAEIALIADVVKLIIIADAPPFAPPLVPVHGQLWWESDTGNLFVHYDDGTSGQWVQISGPSGTIGASAPGYLRWACGDETTPVSAGNAKVTDRMPYAFTATGIKASLNVAQASGAVFTVDFKWWNGSAFVTALSTLLTFDNTETTTTTAATAAVLSKTSFANDDLIRIDVTQVGSGDATGLKVTLLGQKA